MKNAFLMAAAISIVTSAPVLAEERGTAAEASAMLDRAAVHFQKVGAQQAYKDFSTKGNEWQDRDLYVFCFDKAGVTLAHGANEKLIGKNLTELKDADGKQFISELVATGLKGQGWVDYRWANPMTKKIEPKSSLARPFGDGVCGVGIYK